MKKMQSKELEELTKESEKKKQEEEKKKQEEEKKKQALIDEFLNDAKRIKYKIKNNRLYILLYDFEEPYYKYYNISKNKDLLILDNTTISLKKSFLVGPEETNIKNNYYYGSILTSSKIIDTTDYREIYLISEGIKTFLCGYDFENELFKKYKNELLLSYNLVINSFFKIFNDASGNYDFEEVRATTEEEEILDSLIKKNEKDKNLKQ